MFKTIQSQGYSMGEILKEINPDKFIIKSTNGPRYVVGVKPSISKDKLKVGTRVCLDP